jgi:hypothetical protein
MDIVGSSSRIPHDVILEANPSLIGDAVSIHLSQQPDSAALWTLHVDVHIAQGWFRLGSMVTSSPELGAAPARTVAIASCPGAIGWRVVAECATNEEFADLVLQSSASSAGTGVTPLEGSTATEDDRPWLNSFTTGSLQTAILMRAAPAIVRNITLTIDAALGTATYYVQLWNLAAVPGNGLIMTPTNGLSSAVPVAHVFNTTDLVRFDFAEDGIEATAGVAITLSSTRFSQTDIAGNHLALLTGEFR